MTLRRNWILLQLAEARREFAEAPAYMYHGSPLQGLKKETDAKKEQPQ